PVAVGMYLPFGLAPPILLGGLMAHFFAKGSRGADEDKRLGRGVLFSSGVIAGESLMGVGLALLASVGLGAIHPALGEGTLTALTLIATALVIGLFARYSKPADA